jgi:N4-gp56 family major capsid protein
MKNLFCPILAAFLTLGIVNAAASFSSDVEAYIQEEVEPLARRQLVAYQFGKPLHLDVNRGTTYTASRYQRLPLPFAQLQEGVAPSGEAMTLFQVSATAQQWGDCVIITDVANLTIKHPLFQQAIQLVSIQMPETFERNTFNTLLAANQVNYANGRANRAALVATDVMTPHESNKVVRLARDLRRAALQRRRARGHDDRGGRLPRSVEVAGGDAALRGRSSTRSPRRTCARTPR